MAYDVLEHYLFRPDESLSTFLPRHCNHHISKEFTRLVGFTEFQSDFLFAKFPNQDQIEVSQLFQLTPRRLIQTNKTNEFARPFALWMLLNSFSSAHIARCDLESETLILADDVYAKALKITSSPLEEWELTVRSYNVLKREGISSIYSLSQLTRDDLRSFRNLGEGSIIEIEDLLVKHGLWLKESPNLESIFSNTSNMHLSQLGLSTRAYNSLMRKGITNLNMLLGMSATDISDIRNIGPNTVDEILQVQNKFRSSEPTDEAVEATTAETKIATTEIGRECLLLLKEDVDALLRQLTPFGTLQISSESSKGMENESFAFLRKLFGTSDRNIERVLEEVKSKSEEITQPEYWIDFLLLFAKLEDYLVKFIHINTFLLPTDAELNELTNLQINLDLDSVTCFVTDIPEDSYFEVENFGKYEHLISFYRSHIVLNSWSMKLHSAIRKFIIEHKSFPNSTGLAYACFAQESPNRDFAQLQLLSYLESTNPTTAQRDLEIIQSRFEGNSLDKIGREVGLTRERVRQVLLEYSPDLDKTIQASLGVKSEMEREATINSISGLFSKFGALTKEELAQHLQISSDEVLNIVPTRFKKFILDGKAERLTPVTWEKDFVLSQLSKAATYYFPLRTSDYEHLTQIGEISGPSIPWIIVKFGSWSNACMLAGVEPAPALRAEYTRLWNDAELLSFVVRYLLDDGTTGSIGDYRQWRDRQSDHVPSGELIRNQYELWSNAVKQALLQIREQKEFEALSGI